MNGPTLKFFLTRARNVPVGVEQSSVNSPGLPNFLSIVVSVHELSPAFIWLTGGIGTRSLREGAVSLPPVLPPPEPAPPAAPPPPPPLPPPPPIPPPDATGLGVCGFCAGVVPAGVGETPSDPRICWSGLALAVPSLMTSCNCFAASPTESAAAAKSLSAMLARASLRDSQAASIACLASGEGAGVAFSWSLILAIASAICEKDGVATTCPPSVP